MSQTDTNKDNEDNEEYEDLFDKNETSDTLASMLVSPGANVLKTAVFIFILFIILCSDVFVDKVLSSSSNTLSEGRYPNTKGTVVQGIMLSLGYISIHCLVNNGYL
jgi:hypothetical protein